MHGIGWFNESTLVPLVRLLLLGVVFGVFPCALVAQARDTNKHGECQYMAGSHFLSHKSATQVQSFMATAKINHNSNETHRVYCGLKSASCVQLRRANAQEKLARDNAAAATGDGDGLRFACISFTATKFRSRVFFSHSPCILVVSIACGVCE